MQHNRLFRPGLLGLCLTAMLVLAPAAHAQTLDRIKSSGTIKLGYADDVAPFSSGAGTPTGYAIDLCQRIADAVKAKLALPNLTLSYVQVNRANAVDAITKGEVDLLCTPTADTLARRAYVSYSVPVYSGGLGAVTRRDADAALRRVLAGEGAHPGPTWRATVNQGVANHTYAVRAGTLAEDLVRNKIHRLGVAATIVPVENDAIGVQMVLDKKAQAYFSERSLLQEYTARSKGADQLQVVDRNFDYQAMALAMKRFDDDFRLVVDTALSTLYRSDAFPALYSKYFGPYTEGQSILFQSYARP